MKNLFVVFLFCLCGVFAATLNAQPQTVRTTSSAGATSENGRLAVVIGQPFFTQFTAGDYDFSLGVAQAQWTRDTVYDVITYNTPYTENYFNLPAQTESHKDIVYAVNGGIYNYDLLQTLYLIVCPQYMEENNPDYNVLAVSGYCWTKENLRIVAEGAVTYLSPLNATVPQVYGLLYPQTAAQTLCPEGWHLPTGVEMAALSTNPTPTLRSVDGWVNGDINTNSTGFTAYPAGLYNAAAQRFEGLGSETYWWTTAENGTTAVTSLEIPYYCDTPIYATRNANDKLSVRCVKTNIWPD